MLARFKLSLLASIAEAILSHHFVGQTRSIGAIYLFVSHFYIPLHIVISLTRHAAIIYTGNNKSLVYLVYFGCAFCLEFYLLSCFFDSYLLIFVFIIECLATRIRIFLNMKKRKHQTV